MPHYKKGPVTHRVRRFQLGKLTIMLRDIKEEEDALRRRAEATFDEVEESLHPTPHSSDQGISAAPDQLQDKPENPIGDSVETATVAEGLSPRDLNDIPALETHAAQLAANQAADGSAS
eukprot:4540327-Amphidinium_carterae.1